MDGGTADVRRDRRTEGWMDGGTDGRTDVQMDGRIEGRTAGVHILKKREAPLLGRGRILSENL